MGRLADQARGSGNKIFMQLKDGDKKKVRFVFDGQVKHADGQAVTGTQLPFSSFWHRMPEDKTGGTGRLYHEWLCVGSFRNCSLCLKNSAYEATHPPADGKKFQNKDKPWPYRKKIYINAWSYEEQAIRVVSMGPELYDKLKLIEETKRDDLDHFDIILTRKGEGFNTDYDAIPDQTTPFAIPAGQFIYDLEAEVAKADRPETELEEVLSGEFDKKMASRGNQAGQAGPANAASVQSAQALIINFGMHAGKSLGLVMQQDARYVQWLAQNSTDASIQQAATLLLNSVSQQATPPPQPLVAPPAPVPVVPPPIPAPMAVAAPPPAPVAVPAPLPADPFAAAAAAALPAPAAPVKTIEALKLQATQMVMAKPEYRNPTVLAEKMRAAGGSSDITKFDIPMLEKLISIL